MVTIATHLLFLMLAGGKRAAADAAEVNRASYRERRNCDTRLDRMLRSVPSIGSDACSFDTSSRPASDTHSLCSTCSAASRHCRYTGHERMSTQLTVPAAVALEQRNWTKAEICLQRATTAMMASVM